MNCYVCDGTDFSWLNGFEDLPRVTSDAKPFKKGGRLGFCTQCGHVQKDLNSTMAKELDEIYSQYTPFHQSKNDTQVIFIEGKPISRCAFLLEQLSTKVEEKKLKSILDFGCGSCSFLREVHKKYPNTDLYGFDLDNRNEASVSHLESFKKFFSGDYKKIDQKFSMISSIHSLEHIPDPKSILTFMRENLLEDEGYLFVQVPNVQKNSFDLLIADHVSHFTPNSLRHLLTQCGFDIINEKHDWIGKEISCLAQKTKESARHLVPDFSFSKGLEKEINFFTQVMKESKKIAKDKSRPFGVFGTSISSTWLAGMLRQDIDFFVDEDTNRIGTKHLGRPVLSPKEVLNGNVYLPFPKEVCEKICEKYSNEKWDFNIHTPFQ